MAAQEAWTMDAQSGVAAGAKFDVRRMRGRLVAITGIITATVAVEGSLDGTNWFVLGAALTANGYRVVEDGWNYVRANTTAYTSGTIVAKVGGFV